MGLVEELDDIGSGVSGLVTDVPSLVGNIVEGDVHGIVTDGRNLVGNVADVLSGVEGLGVSLGEIPKRYLGNIAKVADSTILAAAQLAIDGQKRLAGKDEPDDGGAYNESATRLDEAMNEVIDANVAPDRWNGAASDAYQDTNETHREHTSATATADGAIATILKTEAGQVARTRSTLDEASQDLYDFGLATSWMMFIPPLIPAKMAADTAAAAAALATTSATMAVLVKNSLENADRIRAQIVYYDNTVENDKSGGDTGCGGGILPQEEDRAELPTRLSESDTYEVPDLDPEWGPPATPYEVPGQTPATAGTTPKMPTPTSPAPRAPAGTASTPAPNAPRPAAPPPAARPAPTPAPLTPAGAGPGTRATERAPLRKPTQPTRTASTRDAN